MAIYLTRNYDKKSRVHCNVREKRYLENRVQFLFIPEPDISHARLNFDMWVPLKNHAECIPSSRSPFVFPHFPHICVHVYGNRRAAEQAFFRDDFRLITRHAPIRP